MKYLISEKQYRIILEQDLIRIIKRVMIEQSMGGMSSPQTFARSSKESLEKIDSHTLMTITQIGTAFIPMVGPFISAGIGLADAALYYKQGDSKSAGLVGALSVLPFVGSVVSKIPGVKQLGAKGMSALASKLSTKGAKLSKLELSIVNQLSKNQSLIKNELSSVSQTLKQISEKIKVLRPKYIERFGQKSYDDLFSKLVSKKITKEEFIKTLQSSKVANPNSAKFLTKFGIKFLPEELQSIKNISKGILGGKGYQISLVQTKNGLKKVTIQVLDTNAISQISPNAVKSTAFKYGDNIIVLNKSKISSKSLQEIEELVGHEVAHIKDPSMVSSKLGSTYSKSAGKTTVKNYDLHPWEINANTSASLQTLTNTTNSWMKYLPKDQLLGYLDNIINWGKGTTKTINPEVFQKMIGKQGMEQLITMYKYDKKAYSTFLKKIVQQADYLKGQVKIAM